MSQPNSQVRQADYRWRLSHKFDLRIYAMPELPRQSNAELIELASPPCHECGAPVQRIENRWHLDEDATWRLGPCFAVCRHGHRVLMEPLA